MKRKFYSLIMILLPASVIFLIIAVILGLIPYFLPDEVLISWKNSIINYSKNPLELKNFLLEKGSYAEIIFILLQILQVVIAPIPGQAVAFAGGFIFGFWKGWLLTTLGLSIGSFIAMAGARILGYKLVRKIVSDSIIKQFDRVIYEGGYMTFFMIFLLPALPDDSVCFMAGLTKLKLLPLSLVCLIGRAPGMIVLSLLGSGIASGLAAEAYILFVIMICIAFFLWLFWEYVEDWIYEKINLKF
ncbi:MAG: TVP38/TMEM64 family protein [Synergistaceae bacterium]|nr:TVP38/TMEM64 family protein [Synergistaceae bacterium]